MKYLCLLLLILNPFHLQAGDFAPIDLRYCSNVGNQECYEMQAIQRNYNRYGKLLKQVAYRRLNEIRNKLLSKEAQVNAYSKMIDNAVNVQDLPAQVVNVIQVRHKQYMSLSDVMRKQLIGFNLGFVLRDDLSDVNKDFLLGENLLINDNYPVRSQGK